MPSTQNAVNNHEYRSVPITALAESATGRIDHPLAEYICEILEDLPAHKTDRFYITQNYRAGTSLAKNLDFTH